VALVRLSGSKAFEIAGHVFLRWPEQPQSHRIYFGPLVHGDDGLALVFAEGRSYTGEATVEFSIHGSSASVRALVEACRTHGARMAEPGEFTQRAFLNGRLDLTQAEAVRDTVQANTDRQLRQANLLRDGALSNQIAPAVDTLVKIIAAMEASIDFSEEVGEFDRLSALPQLQEVLKNIEQWLATAESGRLLREGVRVALVGRPNVGKSSLLNRLLRQDRAIVSDIAGTTRDTVEEAAELGGHLVLLIDTAGLRNTKDQIESLGIARTWSAIHQVDVVWYIFDSAEGWTPIDQEWFDAIKDPKLLIANKIDRGPTQVPNAVAVSALTGEGLDSLADWVTHFVGSINQAQPLIQGRHQPSLIKSRSAIERALATIQSNAPDDLAIVHLREALTHLGEITGETASEDLLHKIFRDFCIGK